uniref:Uncharacterized protein n=1 Tax=Trichuris muris TaxID=70415 RepID=A0A5S6QUB7_TRIMR
MLPGRLFPMLLLQFPPHKYTLHYSPLRKHRPQHLFSPYRKRTTSSQATLRTTFTPMYFFAYRATTFPYPTRTLFITSRQPNYCHSTGKTYFSLFCFTYSQYTCTLCLNNLFSRIALSRRFPGYPFFTFIAVFPHKPLYYTATRYLPTTRINLLTYKQLLLYNQLFFRTHFPTFFIHFFIHPALLYLHLYLTHKRAPSDLLFIFS